MYADLTTLCIHEASSFRAAIAHMDRSRLGIVLIVDEDRRLVGTITDGDVRRAILERTTLDQPVTGFLAQKAGTRYANPITSSITAGQDAWLRVLQYHKIFHLPILDEVQRVVGLAAME